MPVIELAPRPAMNGDHLDPGILGNPGQARRVAVFVVPARAHFQRHGKLYGLDHRFENLCRLGFFPHQGGAGVTVHHLLDRTPHIDVDERRTAVFVELGGFRHDVRLAPGQLHGHRKFLGTIGRHLHGLAVLPDHGLARDHLGDNQSGAFAFHEAPKRQVGHA